MFGHPPRDVGVAWDNPADPAIGEVFDVVQRWHVCHTGSGKAQQQFAAATRRAFGLELTDQVGDRQCSLLAVPEHRSVDEVGDRFGVECGVASGDHERIVVGAIDRVQRDAGEIQRRQHIGVAELGGEGQPEDIEGTDRSMSIYGELRDTAFAHEGLKVGPHGIGALGKRILDSVDHLVQDLHALVGCTDLIGIGIHQHPAHGRVGPLLDHRVDLAADVLDRFGDERQNLFELAEDRFGGNQVLRRSHDHQGSRWADARGRVLGLGRGVHSHIGEQPECDP